MTFIKHRLLFLLILGLSVSGQLTAQNITNNSIDIEVNASLSQLEITNGTLNQELLNTTEYNHTYTLAESILIWELIFELSSLRKNNFTNDDIILNAVYSIRNNYSDLLNRLNQFEQITIDLKRESDAMLRRERHRNQLQIPNVQLTTDKLTSALESIISQDLSYTDDTLLLLNESAIMQEPLAFDALLTIRIEKIKAGDLPLQKLNDTMVALDALQVSQQQLKLQLLQLQTAIQQIKLDIENLTPELQAFDYISSNYFLIHNYNIHEMSLIYLWQKCLFSADLHLLIDNEDANLNLSQPLSKLLLLARAYRQNNRLSYAQFSEIEDWHIDNPQHIASTIAKFVLQNFSYEKLNLPTKILVALPFTGAYATAGNSIRNGILNSYYKEAQYGSWQPKMKFIDSNLFSHTQIIIAAESFGAHHILGPLTKKKVAQVLDRVNYHPQIKGVLALNWVDTPQNLDLNIWLYSLAAEQEVEEIALYAKTKGWKKGLGVYSESVWGIRTGHYFEKIWQDYGGQWIGSEGVPTQQISAAIGQDILLIDKSMARHRSLSRYLNQELQFIPRRREDVDFIFHSSNSQHAARMLATLKFNFALGIPIITLSSAYQPNKTESQNDIEGVVFSDFPWILGTTKAQQLSANRSDPEQLNRLYAMGVDSWQLMKNLLISPPSIIFPYYGVTGTLFKTDSHKIWLRPVIAKFEQIDKKPIIYLNR